MAKIYWLQIWRSRHEEALEVEKEKEEIKEFN